MKPFKYSIFFVAFLAIAAFALVHAQAGYIFQYDWDNPNIQASAVLGTGTNPYSSGQGAGGPAGGGVNLNGQDGWERVPYWTGQGGQLDGDPRVFTNGPGNSGNTLHEYNDNANWLKTSQHYLFEDHSYRQFTAADTAIILGFRLYTGLDTSYVGLGFDGYPPEKSRGAVAYSGTASGGAKKLQFIEYDGTVTKYGDTQLTQSHWYDVIGIMNFAPIALGQSPTISFYYRDLGTDLLNPVAPAPEDPTGYVADTLLVDLPIWATPQASYRANLIHIRQDRYGSGYQNAIDLVGLYDASVIPEPSTLVLLGCGLIGLLAYAWRKRK